MTNKQGYILGIDIGTGSTKAIACDINGKVLASAQYHYPTTSFKQGYSEQDPSQILSAFINCVKDIVVATGYTPNALSFSSAMHSLIAVDIYCTPLAPMMTWADARSEEIATRLRTSAQGVELYHNCGTPIHAMSPLCKIIWIRENEREIFKKAHKFICIKEYLWYFLFKTYEVDHSMASSTGIFDIDTLVWNKDALNLAGITTEQLSVPVPTTFSRNIIQPESAAMITLPTTIPVVTGGSDGCCANLGSFVDKPGIASLTIGTSGAVRITSAVKVLDDQAMIFNYLLDEHTYVCGGAINNGGNVLDWLLKTFSADATYTEAFTEMNKVNAGSDGLIFLPYLYGERAPLWDTKTCGNFFNIKPVHTHAHFLRAGLEGICFALNDVLRTLEKASCPIETVHISGGFISSVVWTQMLADITGKQLVIVQQEDASAIGAVFLAMRALDIKAMEQPVYDMMIIPDMERHLIYQKNFAVFKKLYNTLADTMHRVHDGLDT